MKTINEMIESLKTTYGQIETISIEGADRLEKVLSLLCDSDLQKLAGAKIRWVSYKAGLILATKVGRREEYAIDFVVDSIIKDVESNTLKAVA